MYYINLYIRFLKIKKYINKLSLQIDTFNFILTRREMKNEEWSYVFKHPTWWFDRNLINPTKEIIRMRKSIFSSIPIIDNRDWVYDRYERCTDLVLMNLYIAVIRDVYLSCPISGNHQWIQPICEENNLIFTSKRLKEILYAMKAMGLVRIYKGFPAKDEYSTGMVTRIIPTNEFKRRININTPLWFGRGTFKRNPIQIRDKRKKLNQFPKKLTIDDRKFIRQMEGEITELNNLYQRTVLSCHIPIGTLNQTLGEKLADFVTKQVTYSSILLLRHNIYNPYLSIKNINYDYNQDMGIYINNYNIYNILYTYNRNFSTNPSNYLELFKKLRWRFAANFVIKPRALYRIFNDKGFKFWEYDKIFKCGGRHYGGLWQIMSKHFRKFIKINGEETIELDYSGMHIRMLYHAKKIDYRGDPYIDPENKVPREWFKAIALRIFNNKNRRGCIGSIRKAMLGLTGSDIGRYNSEKLLDRFIKMHPQIADRFYSNIGLNLQNLDSQIMHNILMELKSQDIVGLPIYDSVIVKKKHKELLRSIMIDKYKKLFGFDPII